MQSKRTQAERTARTRAALMAAARPLFAARGVADVGTDEIARAAGVSRGALYHQFDGKTALFSAVFEQVEHELSASIAAAVVANGEDPVGALRAGVVAWLEACADPEVSRIALIEAPAVLGWERWREVGREHGVGLVEAALTGLADAGLVASGPVRPLAHVLVGALEEAALYAARAEDPVVARHEVRDALFQVIEAMVRT